MNGEWHSIESAPYNYTVFIVYWTEDEGVVSKGYYCEENQCWLDVENCHFQHEPTHWMHMKFPNPPPRPETK